MHRLAFKSERNISYLGYTKLVLNHSLIQIHKTILIHSGMDRLVSSTERKEKKKN